MRTKSSTFQVSTAHIFKRISFCELRANSQLIINIWMLENLKFKWLFHCEKITLAKVYLHIIFILQIYWHDWRHAIKCYNSHARKRVICERLLQNHEMIKLLMNWTFDNRFSIVTTGKLCHFELLQNKVFLRKPYIKKITLFLSV